MDFFITIGPVVSAIIVSIVGYWAATRKMSGKVQTSEASELWAESRKMREELNQRNEFLRSSLDKCNERILSLEERINELETKNFKLHLENGDLRRLIEQHEETIARQVIRITALENERDALKQANYSLEKRVEELERP